MDRRKGFLDLVERLGQGVVAITPAETGAGNCAGDEVNGEPRQSSLPRTRRL